MDINHSINKDSFSFMCEHFGLEKTKDILDRIKIVATDHVNSNFKALILIPDKEVSFMSFTPCSPDSCIDADFNVNFHATADGGRITIKLVYEFIGTSG